MLPWRLWAVFPLYGLPLLAFLYLTGERPISTPLQIFGATTGGAMMGGIESHRDELARVRPERDALLMAEPELRQRRVLRTV